MILDIDDWTLNLTSKFEDEKISEFEIKNIIEKIGILMDKLKSLLAENKISEESISIFEKNISDLQKQLDRADHIDDEVNKILISGSEIDWRDKETI